MEKSIEPKDGYLPLMLSDKILCVKDLMQAAQTQAEAMAEDAKTVKNVNKTEVIIGAIPI